MGDGGRDSGGVEAVGVVWPNVVGYAVREVDYESIGLVWAGHSPTKYWGA